MCITLRPAVASIGKDPDKNLLDMAQKMAGQATMNAQGNSGTIFSFVFSKLSATLSEHKGQTSLDVMEFADCLTTVGDQMNTAMTKPVIGTLLSVIADSFGSLKGEQIVSIEQLIRTACEASKASLAKTPDQLIVNGVKVLKNFRGKTVVDSGAQGFVYLLEG